MNIPSPALQAFPVFFRMENSAVLMIGCGVEVLNKARLLAQSVAKIRILVPYSDVAEPELIDFVLDGGHSLRALDQAAHLSDQDLHNVKLAFIATGDEQQDLTWAEILRAQHVAVNVVDRPHLCDFYTPALVNRAPLAIAIGTEGAGPVLSQKIRQQIDAALSPRLGDLARLAASYRERVEKTISAGSARRQFWHDFFSGAVAQAIERGDWVQAEQAAEALLQQNSPSQGFVWLVGAGPGAEDLLTLRAQRVLMQADVILYDALVPGAVVAMGRRDAVRISVGKRKSCHSKTQNEINELIVELALAGKQVARLKSGDPLIYGRAGEEMAALRAANIPFEVVSGITSAFAAAADMQLPLTLRGVASSLVFTTGHDMTGDILPDWARLALSGATIAVYMGASVAASVASRLISAGLHKDTAVAVVENAGRDTRKMLHGLLKDLALLERRKDLSGPVMVVIGDAVAGASVELAEPLALARFVTSDKKINYQRSMAVAAPATLPATFIWQHFQQEAGL